MGGRGWRRGWAKRVIRSRGRRLPVLLRGLLLVAFVSFAVAGATITSSLASADTVTNLVSNGGFESPPAVRTDLDTFNAPSTALTNWTIESGSIDRIDGYWPAREGARSIDLDGSNGNAPGATRAPSRRRSRPSPARATTSASTTRPTRRTAPRSSRQGWTFSGTGARSAARRSTTPAGNVHRHGLGSGSRDGDRSGSFDDAEVPLDEP